METRNHRGLEKENAIFSVLPLKSELGESYASTYPDGEIGQRPVDQLPWGCIIVLLTKFDSNEDRDWYAREALENGWSRTTLPIIEEIETELESEFLGGVE